MGVPKRNILMIYYPLPTMCLCVSTRNDVVISLCGRQFQHGSAPYLPFLVHSVFTMEGVYFLVEFEMGNYNKTYVSNVV